MRYKIKRQKVYHDGTSMIVLKPGMMAPIPDDKVQTFIDEDVIDGKKSKELAKEQAAQAAEHDREQAGIDTTATYRTRTIPGGRVVIEGPDGFKETVKREDAEARVAVLNAAENLDDDGEHGGTGDGDGDAPAA